MADWNPVIAGILHRRWKLVIEPADMLGGVNGTSVELTPLEGSGRGEVIRADEPDPDAVQNAVVGICRQFDPEF